MQSWKNIKLVHDQARQLFVPGPPKIHQFSVSFPSAFRQLSVFTHFRCLFRQCIVFDVYPFAAFLPGPPRIHEKAPVFRQLSVLPGFGYPFRGRWWDLRLRLSIYLSIYLYTYLYIYIYMYMCVYTYIYIYIYTYASTYVSLSLYIYIYIYLLILNYMFGYPFRGRWSAADNTNGVNTNVVTAMFIFLSTGGTFAYSRQIYVPLCLLYYFEQGIFNLFRARFVLPDWRQLKGHSELARQQRFVRAT